MISPRIRKFIAEVDPPSPCLVVDLDVLATRWREFRALFPDTRICYAVKANPHPAIIAMLVELGADFDVASRGEIELCLANGASGDSLSYGNTIKKPADIEFAYRHGIRLFSTDSESDIRAIAKYAPNSAVCCRIQVPQDGARTPFGDKFGCPPAQAPALLSLAARLGLRPRGVALHVGSQNENPGAWRTGIEAAATVIAASTATLAAAGIDVPTLNVGGGFPIDYRDPVPELSLYAKQIRHDVAAAFNNVTFESARHPQPALMLEPGRALVGHAGVLRAEVVLVRPGRRRWVFLDVGRYNGLAETENEAIRYPIITDRDGEPTGPVVLAGPSCDGDDVLYRRADYRLPLTLRPGDRVLIAHAGAYTASYSSVFFNGIEPLRTHCLELTEELHR